MEGMFYAFQLPTSPAYSGWKVEVNIHCTKIVKGKGGGGGEAVKCYHNRKGKDAPAPALDLERFFLYSIISAQ